jgi:hypothetical protein
MRREFLACAKAGSFGYVVGKAASFAESGALNECLESFNMLAVAVAFVAHAVATAMAAIEQDMISVSGPLLDQLETGYAEVDRQTPDCING